MQKLCKLSPPDILPRVANRLSYYLDHLAETEIVPASDLEINSSKFREGSPQEAN